MPYNTTIAPVNFPKVGAPGDDSTKGPLNESHVRRTRELVISSGILERLKIWREEDGTGHRVKGGRPAVLSDDVMLTVMLALIGSGEPALLTSITNVLRHRLTQASRELLGLPQTDSSVAFNARYHQVHRALVRLTEPFEPTPGLAGQRRTAAEHEAYLGSIPPSVRKLRQERAIWLSNQMLEATFQLLPRDARRAWKGNLCVDATLLRVWGKHGSPTRKTLEKDPTRRHSPEPLAGWYHRDADHRDPGDGHGRKNSKSAWGYEAHLMVMTGDGQTSPAFPLLILGVSMDKPAGRVAENAMAALTSINARGHRPGFLVGDRAYLFNAAEEKLQLPATALGYDLCGDYRDDQLGIQGNNAGSILVEGNWYCPSMPTALVNATRDFRQTKQRTEDQEAYAQRIQQRAKYLLSPKDTRDEKGAYRMSCPATGPYPTLSCDLRPSKATQPTSTGLGMPKFRALTPVIEPPAQPERICTNASGASFPATAGAKYAQKLQYKSEPWQKMYGHNRNTIEGSNAYLKDAAHEDLENPGRRRVRGFAKQLLLTTLSVVSANLRKIRKWQEEQTSAPAPRPDNPLKLTRKRRAARTPPRHDLRTYKPDSTEPPPDTATAA